MGSFNPLFSNSYQPLKAGSIDGTDEVPHDRAIARAMCAKFRPSKNIPGDPDCNVFIARLNPTTTEQTIQRSFWEFGPIQRVKIVRDVVTGYSKCYGFIEFEDSYHAASAIRSGNKMVIDDHEILVDSEKERSLKGWIPRRLGGGLGGKRESGQLRFGGRDRPFSKPILRPESSSRRDDTSEGRSSYRHKSYPDGQRNRRRSRSRERSSYYSRNKSQYR